MTLVRNRLEATVLLRAIQLSLEVDKTTVSVERKQLLASLQGHEPDICEEIGARLIQEMNEGAYDEPQEDKPVVRIYPEST